jgi:hypothetical protein
MQPCPLSPPTDPDRRAGGPAIPALVMDGPAGKSMQGGRRARIDLQRPAPVASAPHDSWAVGLLAARHLYAPRSLQRQTNQTGAIAEPPQPRLKKKTDQVPATVHREAAAAAAVHMRRPTAATDGCTSKRPGLIDQQSSLQAEAQAPYKTPAASAPHSRLGWQASQPRAGVARPSGPPSPAPLPALQPHRLCHVALAAGDVGVRAPQHRRRRRCELRENQFSRLAIAWKTSSSQSI